MNLKFSKTLLLAICFCLAGEIFCQVDKSNLQAAVLESRRVTENRDNYTSAAFSFEKGVNGESGRKITRNDWDLLFFSIRQNDGTVVKDLFTVTTITDDRSRIKDLGAFNWTDDFEIPELPAFETPAREIDVSVNVGHIYLVHTKDTDSDSLALFRVEELKSGESVKISWKLISNLKEN